MSNGGAVSSQTVITYLRENAPMYIYSNPITPAEAEEAYQALESWIARGKINWSILEI